MNAIKRRYDCIVCNNSVEFLGGSNYCCCNACNNVLFKKNDESLEVKLIPVIKQSSSSIKIGTKGNYNGDAFTVVGRCIIDLKNENESIFYLVFDNGKQAYLVVNLGFYSIAYPQLISSKDLLLQLGAFGTKKMYQITDTIKGNFIARERTKNFSIQGCCYFGEVDTELSVYAFEFESKKIKVIKQKQNSCFLYMQDLIDVEELHLQNTNTSTKQIIDCPKCQSPIEIHDIDNVYGVACGSCKSQFNYTKNGLVYLEKNSIDVKNVYFELNQKLTFNKIDYTVVGIAIKQDYSRYKSKWREYCLYHPTKGYAFLNEYNGHWTLSKRLWSNEDVPKDFEIIELQDKEYELYNKYTYQTLYAQGEFPYPVFQKKEINCYEYIAPPVMVIKEKINSRINWFTARHVSKKELQKQCNKTLPYKTGVGAIENKGTIKTQNIFLTAIMFALLAGGLHLLIGSTKQQKTLVNESYNIPDSISTFSKTIANLNLTKSTSNIEFRIIAPVYNSWFEINAELVNTKTGESFTVEQGIEYYRGYDGGESWSEGSTSESVMLSKIPAGNYNLNILATQNSYNKVSSFDLIVTYDTAIDRNFWLLVLFIFIAAFIIYLMNYFANYRRWQDSPYFLNKYPNSNS